MGSHPQTDRQRPLPRDPSRLSARSQDGGSPPPTQADQANQARFPLKESILEGGSVFKVDASRDAVQPRAWPGGGRRAMWDIVRGRQRSQGCGWATSRRARGGARRDAVSSSSPIVPLSPSSLSLPRLGGAPCAATPHFENRP